MKARRAADAKKLSDIPNIGPAMVRDFTVLGIYRPNDLVGQDAFGLYTSICTIRGTRQDPCVLDTYMAAIDFMQGAPARSWWYYTKIRKKKYKTI